MNHCHYLLIAATILFANVFAAPLKPPHAQDLPSGNKPKGPVKVPQLLLDIYECWNKGGDHCLDVPVANDKVNAVKSFSGDCESVTIKCS